MSWHTGTMGVLDFETTGVDPLTCRPVSVACALVTGSGEVALSVDSVIDCGVEVPEEAAAIHGLTTEKVRESGQPPGVVLERVSLLIAVCQRFQVPVVIMNARFDWPMLHAECERQEIAHYWPHLYLLDPSVLDRAMDKYRAGKRKLPDLACHYGVELSAAHDAMSDALAAVGVMRAIAETFPVVREAELDMMQSVQAQLFRLWRDDLNAYWARIGKEDRVSGEWPMGEAATSEVAA